MSKVWNDLYSSLAKKPNYAFRRLDYFIASSTNYIKKNPIFVDFFGQVWKAKILFPEKKKKKNDTSQILELCPIFQLIICQE